MRIIETDCKFCKKHIVMKVADDSDQDAERAFLPLVCCNRCADAKITMDKVEQRLKRLLHEVSAASPSNRKSAESKVHQPVLNSLKEWATAYSDFHRYSTFPWDDSLADDLTSNPSKLFPFLRALRTTIDNENRNPQPELLNAPAQP